jgi:hypothetical protein
MIHYKRGYETWPQDSRRTTLPACVLDIPKILARGLYPAPSLWSLRSLRTFAGVSLDPPRFPPGTIGGQSRRPSRLACA